MEAKKIIGVVGGVGPHAGLDLVRNIFGQTSASADQDHISVALLSYSDQIEDRTSFITGKTTTNPAFAIDAVLRDLEMLGASVAGIACNTAHAPSIFSVILKEMKKRKSALNLLHMIEELARFVQEHYPAVKRFGLLATLGTVTSRVYQTVFEEKGFRIFVPDDEIERSVVHRAIYDPEHGIKAKPDPVSEQARADLLKVAARLEQQGAQAIILGCTEVSLAITEKRIGDAIILDPSLILARALIREIDPGKLKPFVAL